jgi:predicted dehydrogenase
MSNRMWRGGMIGAGAWSEIQLTAWAGVENAEIVALCDRTSGTTFQHPPGF